MAKRLVLLFGSTGPSGFHIAKNILSDPQLALRVIVRSEAKLRELFPNHIDNFESVVVGELTSDQALERSFNSSQIHGAVHTVVSCLGSKKKEEVELIDFTAQVRIIEVAKTHKVQKFLLVTTAYMERPHSFVPFMLNSFLPNVMYEKARAERHLRASGIDYAIVRPPRLIGGTEEAAHSSKKGYTLEQGDTVRGQIHRSVLGKVVHEAIISNQLTKNVTFQCLEALESLGKEGFARLKQDGQDMHERVQPHLFIKAKQTWRLKILTAILLLGLIIFRHPIMHALVPPASTSPQ